MANDRAPNLSETFSVRVEPGVAQRVQAVSDLMPGWNDSDVLRELVSMGLAELERRVEGASQALAS